VPLPRLAGAAGHDRSGIEAAQRGVKEIDMEVTRYDAVIIRASETPEGYLTDSPIIGRTGVQVYRTSAGREIREYRPPEVVFAADHLAAIRGRPIIDGHVPQVDGKNVRQHMVGTVLSEGRQDGDHLRADIIIHDTSAIKAGRRELSLGYRVVVREEPGTTPQGERYDTIVERIAMVDHLAIVPKGRAGVARLNLDADDAISIHHEDEATMPNLVSVRLDGGLSYEAPQEVAAALTKVQAELAAANRRADAAEAERDTLRTTVSGFDAERNQIRADAAAGVRSRLELEAQATQHGVQVRADMSDRAVREAVVIKLRGDAVRFDGKSDDYVGFAFDHAMSDAAARAAATGNQRALVNGVPRADGHVPTPSVRSAQAARDAMIRRG
jgi:hypothetical protein